MSSVTECTVLSMDTEHLLREKVELSRLGFLEPELKSNLQFAISALDRIPDMLKRNAELLVEGSHTLLRIRANSLDLLCLRCVVFQDNEGIKLHQTIKFNRELCKDDLHQAFFHSHDCPHDTPCWKQAKSAIYPGRTQIELNIVCKELRITFSDPNPVKAIMVPYYM